MSYPKDLADAAHVSYSRFIRTTDEDHYAAVKHLWVSADLLRSIS